MTTDTGVARPGPFPPTRLSLVRALDTMQRNLDRSGTMDAMDRFETQVDRAVASNPEIEELVRRLEEEQSEEESELSAGDMPSGDTIAQDFQRFLRQRSDEHERPPDAG